MRVRVLAAARYCAVALCVAACLPFDPGGPQRGDSSNDRRDLEHRRKGAEDLGVAPHPNTALANPVDHLWDARGVTSSSYTLGYAITPTAMQGLADAFHRYARKVGYARSSEDTFRWRPPTQRCRQDMRCVYEALDSQDRAAIQPVAALFKKHAHSAGLDTTAIVKLVVSFVQAIPYRIPKEEPFGVLPPALVVAKSHGDCDSKSLLALMILRELGVRSMLISSEAHKHTMLGVALPASGNGFTHQGTRYAFVEMTAKRAPMGHINPRLLRPNDWRAVPLRAR